jgi:hypothetical protein
VVGSVRHSHKPLHAWQPPPTRGSWQSAPGQLVDGKWQIVIFYLQRERIERRGQRSGAGEQVSRARKGRGHV